MSKANLKIGAATTKTFARRDVPRMSSDMYAGGVNSSVSQRDGVEHRTNGAKRWNKPYANAGHATSSSFDESFDTSYSKTDKQSGSVSLASVDTRGYLTSSPPWTPNSRQRFSVTLKKDPKYGFGMLLRRGSRVEHLKMDYSGEFIGKQHQVLFAEPGPSGVCCGLLPGDRIVGVNGTDVQQVTGADVVQLIRASGSSVTLTVEPISETAEFSNRTILPSAAVQDEQDADYLEVPDARLVEVRQRVTQHGGFRGLGSYLHDAMAFTLWNTSLSRQLLGQSDTGCSVNGSKSFGEDETDVPIWLSVHDGYSAGKLLSSLPNNRCRILLLPDGDVVEVNADDVQRANPPSFDRVEDLSDLRYINECSVINTLLQRFGSGHIYTYAPGAGLLSVNPMMPLNLYSEPIMDLFMGCENRKDMPPHVYSVVQLALARLNRCVSSGDSTKEVWKESKEIHSTIPCQAICLTGRSGSGKTRASLDILSYILHQSGRALSRSSLENGCSSLIGSGHVTAERLRAIFCVLDAFTCSRILLNTNASRALRLFSVEFVCSAKNELIISGLRTHLLLLEHTRVTERPEGEPNFHIFYYLLAGLDSKSREELYLNCTDSGNLFMTKLNRIEDKEAARKYWIQLSHDVRLLGFNLKEEWLTGGIARLLAIIYHLGCAGWPRTDDSSIDPKTARGFLNAESAHRAAYLLGISVEQLTAAVFGTADDELFKWTPTDCLKGFVQGLYQITVDILVALLNRRLSTSPQEQSSIVAQLLLVDPSGLQVPYPGGRSPSSATFSDLLINYANERLNLLSHETAVELERSRLKREDCSASILKEEFSNSAALIDLLDAKTSEHGVFWMLEEAAKQGETKNFTKKLEEIYQSQRNTMKSRDKRTLRRVKHSSSFVLNHNLSSVPIEYAPTPRWLANCRLCPSYNNAADLVRQCGCTSLRRLSMLCNSSPDRCFGQACPTYFDDPSVCTVTKRQLDFLVGLLKSTAVDNSGPPADQGRAGFNDGGPTCGLHFIHCLLPAPNAGLCQLATDPHSVPNHGPTNGDSAAESSSPAKQVKSPARFCVSLVRTQLWGLDLLQRLRFHRFGFPDRLGLKEFRARFTILLVPSKDRVSQFTDEQFPKYLFESLNCPHQSYLVGKTQLFLRSYVLPQLELQRMSLLAGCCATEGRVTVQQSISCNFVNRDGVEADECDHTCAADSLKSSTWIQSAAASQQQTTVSEDGFLTLKSKPTPVFNSEMKTNSLAVLESKALRSQLAESQIMIEELTIALAQARSAFQNSSGPSAQVAQELKDLHQIRQQLTEKVTTLQTELEDANQDLAAANQSRMRLEQTLERLRADSNRTADEYESEMEAMRSTNQARVRQLEEQLDAAQEEASKANRARLQMEHDLSALNSQLAANMSVVDEETERKLRKELKKYKSVLKEKEAFIEQLLMHPSSEQATLKQLRDRIDELEELTESQNRQKRSMQGDLEDLQQQVAALQKNKKEVEDQLSATKRELIDLTTQCAEYSEAVNEAQRLHQTTLSARSVDAATIEAQSQEISDLLKERESLRARVDDLQIKLSTSDLEQVPRDNVDRLECKIRELEQRLEVETNARNRVQNALERARETVELLTSERDKLLASENSERQLSRKLSRQLRESQQQQEEQAHRALLAQRRADEALTHADQAIRQAAASRAELDAIAKRAHELEARINQKEIQLDLDSDEVDFDGSPCSRADGDGVHARLTPSPAKLHDALSSPAVHEQSPSFNSKIPCVAKSAHQGFRASSWKEQQPFVTVHVINSDKQDLSSDPVLALAALPRQPVQPCSAQPNSSSSTVSVSRSSQGTISINDVILPNCRPLIVATTHSVSAREEPVSILCDDVGSMFRDVLLVHVQPLNLASPSASVAFSEADDSDCG
ncbi:unnamed protein product [Calicophoron daubneyi]|uniref:Myosin XVIIIA n=1 Tax=Calicophoron daubneyi TaxID=300641 RepID=A0AAV2TI54_CALDB